MIVKVSETYRTQSSASPDYAQLSYSHSPQHQQQHQRRQHHSNRVHYEQEPVAPRSSSTSNEIIAYVNMPSTTRSPSHHQQQQQRHYENYQRQHLSPPASNQHHHHHNPIMKSLSKSESKLDSWRLWPDYTVEQETDTSVMSNLVETTSPPHVLTAPPQPTANSNNSWIKTFASSSNADSCRFGYLDFCSINY